jgi:hypothetical protein
MQQHKVIKGSIDQKDTKSYACMHLIKYPEKHNAKRDEL